jgi:hypothetical protein
MTTTLNPSFDHRADQHGRITMATTLNPAFDHRANEHASDTGTMLATLNPAIPTSHWQPVEHATPAADRAA